MPYIRHNTCIFLIKRPHIQNLVKYGTGYNAHLYSFIPPLNSAPLAGTKRLKRKNPLPTDRLAAVL